MCCDLIWKSLFLEFMCLGSMVEMESWDVVEFMFLGEVIKSGVWFVDLYGLLKYSCEFLDFFWDIVKL